jgi:hypothetical protein
MQKMEKRRLTVWRPEAYIPLTNEGGTAAHGRLLRPEGYPESRDSDPHFGLKPNSGKPATAFCSLSDL